VPVLGVHHQNRSCCKGGWSVRVTMGPATRLAFSVFLVSCSSGESTWRHTLYTHTHTHTHTHTLYTHTIHTTHTHTLHTNNNNTYNFYSAFHSTQRRLTTLHTLYKLSTHYTHCINLTHTYTHTHTVHTLHAVSTVLIMYVLQCSC